MKRICEICCRVTKGSDHFSNVIPDVTGVKHELGHPFIGNIYNWEHKNDNVNYCRFGIIGIGGISLCLLVLSFIQ